jgi:hypothetical protein
MNHMQLASNLHPPSVPEKFYTVHEAAHESGLTLRQLQWWDEHGILSPVIQYHRRLYTREQLDLAIRMAQLRKAGIRLWALRKYAALPWTSICSVRVGKPAMMGNTLVVAKC